MYAVQLTFLAWVFVTAGLHSHLGLLRMKSVSCVPKSHHHSPLLTRAYFFSLLTHGDGAESLSFSDIHMPTRVRPCEQPTMLFPHRKSYTALSHYRRHYSAVSTIHRCLQCKFRLSAGRRRCELRNYVKRVRCAGPVLRLSPDVSHGGIQPSLFARRACSLMLLTCHCLTNTRTK